MAVLLRTLGSRLRPRHRSRVAWLAVIGLLAACGATSSQAGNLPTAGSVNVFPQNSTFLVGVDRLSVALLDRGKQPILDATASVDVDDNGQVVETRPLQFVGRNYGAIPVYLGLVRFAHTGDYVLVVHVTKSDGTKDSGLAHVTVTDRSPELPVGHRLTEVHSDLRQPILGDPGVTISDIDSGVPPDPFHDMTIAQALAEHRPMVLYFGEPGRCPSRTCGPTVQVLEQIWPQYRDRMVFEHIEIHRPASGDALNPIYVAFGLTSEPWIYFVNADGVVADRFEGFVTVDELRAAADGTLAGKVPAVDLSING